MREPHTVLFEGSQGTLRISQNVFADLAIGMETSLHRQLKEIYGGTAQQIEIVLGDYRIDVVDGKRLIEIQFGSLGAIRKKIECLIKSHKVHVVKPLAARKYLVKHATKNGDIISQRFSPTRQSFFHMFDDLVHFVGPFPHKNLTLEVILTVEEEHRVVSKKRRRYGKDHRVYDHGLRSIEDRREFRTVADLVGMLPAELPAEFTTADLAEQASIPRWLSQKMAYCLRNTGGIEIVGKVGNALLYQTTIKAKTKKRKAAKRKRAA